jgi:hypothetical protein
MFMATRLRAIWSCGLSNPCAGAHEAEESVLTLYGDGNAFLRGLKQRRNESSRSQAADVWDVSELPGTARRTMAGRNASEAVFGSSLTAWLTWLIIWS